MPHGGDGGMEAGRDSHLCPTFSIPTRRQVKVLSADSQTVKRPSNIDIETVNLNPLRQQIRLHFKFSFNSYSSCLSWTQRDGLVCLHLNVLIS